MIQGDVACHEARAADCQSIDWRAIPLFKHGIMIAAASGPAFNIRLPPSGAPDFSMWRRHDRVTSAAPVSGKQIDNGNRARQIARKFARWPPYRGRQDCGVLSSSARFWAAIHSSAAAINGRCPHNARRSPPHQRQAFGQNQLIKPLAISPTR